MWYRWPKYGIWVSHIVLFCKTLNYREWCVTLTVSFHAKSDNVVIFSWCEPQGGIKYKSRNAGLV